MAQLLYGTITTAGTVTGSAVTVPYNVTVSGAAAIFTYGSSGTSAKLWLQTSIDNGVTYADVASFAFTTSSATKVAALGQPTFGTANFAPSDGALADNTIAAIPVGSLMRYKLISTGTYAGTTTLQLYTMDRRF